MPTADRRQKLRARTWLGTSEGHHYARVFLAAANAERFKTVHGWFNPTASDVHGMLTRDMAILADIAMTPGAAHWSEYLEQTAFLLRYRLSRVDIHSARAVLEACRQCSEFARIFLFDPARNGRVLVERCRHLECRRYFLTRHDAQVHCSDRCRNAYHRRSG